MKIFAVLVLILLNTVIIQPNNELNSSTLRKDVETFNSPIIKDNEEKCYAYCFNIVHPILEHTVNIQVRDQQIQEQAALLQKLKNEIADFKIKAAIYEENMKNKDLQLTQQILISDKYRNETVDLKTRVAIFEETIRNKDLLSDKCKNETVAKTNIIAAKDEILSMTNDKLIECKAKLGKCQPPNCLGRLTDVYDIKVPGMDAFSVPCDSILAGSGWTVIQRRMDGSVDFNRNWTEYRQGFGNLRGEFFIGLEKLHLMTKSQQHELYIYLKDFEDKERYARYDNFQIGSEDEMYELKSIGTYTGDAGDAMEYHRKMKFSTPDRKNNVSQRNCGQVFESGWWFNDCYMCNMNGVYRKVNTINTVGINWRRWHTNSLKFVQIMIKPK